MFYLKNFALSLVLFVFVGVQVQAHKETGVEVIQLAGSTIKEIV